MDYDDIKHIIGMKFSSLHGVFFYETNTTSISAPLSLYIPSKDGTYVSIIADGKGRTNIKPIFSEIYHDNKLGFTFIAPLSIYPKLNEFDNLAIESINILRSDINEIIEINNKTKKNIQFIFENDDLYILA